MARYIVYFFQGLIVLNSSLVTRCQCVENQGFVLQASRAVTTTKKKWALNALVQKHSKALYIGYFLYVCATLVVDNGDMCYSRMFHMPRFSLDHFEKMVQILRWVIENNWEPIMSLNLVKRNISRVTSLWSKVELKD